MEPILLIIIFILFFFIIISYSKSNLDFVAISLLCCFIAATITFLWVGTTIDTFIGFIEWPAIIIILSMSIITKIAQDSNILEFVAVKLFKISRGEQRIFFWLICIITTLLAAIISDVVVVLILAPIVIRLCHFLKIRAGTYLLGMTICINIGSIITPFSSGENIIISTFFNLDTLYFIQNYWIFSFFLLFATIFLIDRFILRKEPKIEDIQRKYVIDLIDTDIMVKNKKMFYFNSIAIIITIILFAVLPLLYLTAAVSALILVIVNKSYTKKPMRELLRDIEWEIIFFFISLYVVIECMLQAGFADLIVLIPFGAINPLLVSFIILILISVISGLVANTPTALIFIPIINTLIVSEPTLSVPFLFSFIIGINLGGNFIPQGAACDMMTLKIARDSGVENMSYKRLLKMGALFACIHLGFSILYLLIITPFFS
ncbi:MAG: SLC13 family permease [Candidatus Lokiarchaeia archaeon]|nr:SLC13 family permease [Candidatus Lokiarchaeia archaeon]